MSFRCGLCDTPVKGGTIPIKTVTQRYDNGQIKEERDLCQDCAHEWAKAQKARKDAKARGKTLTPEQRARGVKLLADLL